MSKVKIGFIGTGYMGQQAHLRNYVALDDCEVVAIAEPREKLREAVGARYGIKKTYQNHLELLDDCEVDGIVASQPYDRHAVLLPEVLPKGIPVFTEKPLALTVESAKMLVECAEDSGTLHMVGYHKRSDPAMEYAQSIIREWKDTQVCGQLRYIRATMPPGDWDAGGGQGYINTNEPYPDVRRELPPRDMDPETFEAYNEFVNYYVHQVNALRFLLCESYQVTHASSSGALFVGESETGVTVTIEMAPYKTSVTWEESYLVAFEHGYLKVNLPPPLACQQAGTVTVMQDPGSDHPPTITQPVLPKRSAMLNQAANFVAAIRGEGSAPCESPEAVEDLRISREYIRLKTGR
jgi:predicted dehydrogenase